jgi:hypothetical protein
MKDRLSKLMNARAENIVNGPRVNMAYLPDCTSFPLLMTPRYSGIIPGEWIRSNRDIFYNELNRCGAVLFRGFDIDTVEKFQQFIGAFDSAPVEYKLRSSPRYEVATNIYHSTTYPEDQNINMHSENSYALNWTMNIVFCCITPADEQGQTPIADNRMVYNYLTSDTRDKFAAKGVRYVRNISKGLGLSWQEVFQTDKREEVETECLNNKMEFKWKSDDWLVLSWNNQAIYRHPRTDEMIWFNHAFFFNKYALNEEVLSSLGPDEELPFNTYFGDGSSISKEEIDEIRSAYEKATIEVTWNKGDVLFLDNMLMAHGRRPYKGNRKVIVSMF